jgi:hypothetical protein
MNEVGMGGNVLSFFSNYLKGRPQRVKINNTLSDSMETEYSIPQGTVLGPLLFIMFVNDIFSQKLNGQIISYADDTALVVSARTWDRVETLRNLDMNVIKTWLDGNCLTMNSDKTYILPFAIGTTDLPDQLNVTVHSSGSSNHLCSTDCNKLEMKKKH